MSLSPDPETTRKDVQIRSVAVIIPSRNSQRTLVACLKSIRSQTHPCTIIVVDNGSTDETIAIAQRWASVVSQAGPERSAQRNHGAALTDADVLGFIDSDMALAGDVVEQAVKAIIDGAGAVIVPEETIGNGFWAGVRTFERSFYIGADNIEAARFYRHDIFQEVGGFDESLTGAEDIDLTIRVRQLARIERITARINHDEGKVRYLDACRKKAYYAQGLRGYFTKHGVHSVQKWLQRPWLRRPRELMCLKGAGLLALKTGETIAVLNSLLRDGRPLRNERTQP